jgi:hypothetical protein
MPAVSNYWISPSGAVHDLGEFGTHLEFVRSELGYPEDADEETLREEGDGFLLHHWVRVTGTEGAGTDRVAIQATMRAIRRNAREIEGIVHDAYGSGIRVVDVAIVHPGADEGDTFLSLDAADALADGIVKVIGRERLAEGYPASVVRRRPEIRVRRHRRRH